MALPRVVELFGFAVVVVPRDFVVVVGLPRGFVAVVVLWLVVVTRAFVVVLNNLENIESCPSKVDRVLSSLQYMNELLSIVMGNLRNGLISVVGLGAITGLTFRISH